MGVAVTHLFNQFHTLGFAADLAVVAQDEEDFDFMLRKLNEKYRKRSLEMNSDKTEYLATSQEAVVDLAIDN